MGTMSGSDSDQASTFVFRALMLRTSTLFRALMLRTSTRLAKDEKCDIAAFLIFTPCELLPNEMDVGYGLEWDHNEITVKNPVSSGYKVQR